MAQPQQPMIKPQQVDSLPFLDAQQKQHYKNGLAGLWQQHDNGPEGSQQRSEAKAKILAASQKIMQQITARNRPGSGGQQRPPQNGQVGTGQQPQQQPQTTQNAQTLNQGQQGRQQAQQGQQGQQAQQAQPQGQDLEAALRAKVTTAINQLQVYPEPTTANNQQYESYKQNFKTQLGTVYLKLERFKHQQSALQKHMASLQQEPSDDLKQKLQQLTSACQTYTAQSKGMIDQNERNKVAVAQQRNRQQNAPNRQPQVQANGAPSQNAQRPNAAQGLPNATQNQTSASPAPAQPSFQQPSQPQMPSQAQAQPQAQTQGQGMNTPNQPTPKPMPSQAQQPMSGTAQQNTQSTIQHPPDAQGFQQQNNLSGQQQPQRPQINTQQSQHAGQFPQQFPNAPASAVPQSANATAAQSRPPSLSQQNAIQRAHDQNLAQQNNANQQSSGLQQPPPNIPNGLPFNQQPANSHTPTSGFPQSQQINSNQSKFPIPKTLPPPGATQTPVPGPPSRPTMMGQGGMMNVPGVQKAPPFTLEGEGDHVLSKRKLDELVRQITGSTDPADGLTPEVEESVMSMVDDFVDNVFTKACQMAKLRPGQTLELRDVQMVLERNYGIRIPGYSLDETRTVRKFQPAPGWVAKVQAVQAGKVMGGGNRDA